jgi:hypothetical protein
MSSGWKAGAFYRVLDWSSLFCQAINVGPLTPKIAVSRFIGEVKGNSLHAINHVMKPHYNF